MYRIFNKQILYRILMLGGRVKVLLLICWGGNIVREYVEYVVIFYVGGMEGQKASASQKTHQRVCLYVCVTVLLCKNRGASCNT